ncbi:tagaturonate reductase [Labilibacter marinus]|uniref:tagaturonate reductase n=1 Tax=Labilibacter marinus TaxID=1477105 RepID=UPI000950050A|nr:tagaturonate reductase [Labilibacter marinus]
MDNASQLPQLNRTTYNTSKQYPVKVLQFGEGNFLRAFVDWMIHKANNSINLNAGVVVVQPLERGMVDLLQKQDNLYHVALEGIKDGQPVKESELIDCIIDAINPYAEYEKYLNYILHPELELVVSNTTEAGISRIDNEDINAAPPKSFPGKVCQLLYKRFQHFNGASDKGLTFFCCELIEHNGSKLKEIVLELAASNQLEPAFITWLNQSCSFCNTLVDRIVPGFPKDNIKSFQQAVGYEDNLIVVGEYFHLWAIEAPQAVQAKFPFDQAGLNVVWLDDMTAFRDKKVRILNGSHTALVPVGLLSGHQTVKEAFDDKVLADFIQQMVSQEVIPCIKGDQDALKVFADEILERFYNPYVKHFMKDISLNSISKWITRDYPSVQDYHQLNGAIPKRLSFSLAALLVLYSPHNNIDFTPNDTAEHLEFIKSVWDSDASNAEKVKQILSNEGVWNENLCALPGLCESVTSYLESILKQGIKTAIQSL